MLRIIAICLTLGACVTPSQPVVESGEVVCDIPSAGKWTVMTVGTNTVEACLYIGGIPRNTK